MDWVIGQEQLIYFERIEPLRENKSIIDAADRLIGMKSTTGSRSLSDQRFSGVTGFYTK